MNLLTYTPPACRPGIHYVPGGSNCGADRFHARFCEKHPYQGIISRFASAPPILIAVSAISKSPSGEWKHLTTFVVGTDKVEMVKEGRKQLRKAARGHSNFQFFAAQATEEIINLIGGRK